MQVINKNNPMMLLVGVRMDLDQSKLSYYLAYDLKYKGVEFETFPFPQEISKPALKPYIIHNTVGTDY